MDDLDTWSMFATSDIWDFLLTNEVLDGEWTNENQSEKYCWSLLLFDSERVLKLSVPLKFFDRWYKIKSEYYSVYKNSPFKFTIYTNMLALESDDHKNDRWSFNVYLQRDSLSEVHEHLFRFTHSKSKFMSLEVSESIARSIIFCLVVKPTHICIVCSLHSSKWAAMDERWTRRNRHQVRPRITI